MAKKKKRSGLTTAKPRERIADVRSKLLDAEIDLREEKRKAARLEELLVAYNIVVNEKQAMLEAYYELGRTLTATRAKWLEAEEKLERNEKTYNIKIQTTKDGVEWERKLGP